MNSNQNANSYKKLLLGLLLRLEDKPAEISDIVAQNIYQIQQNNYYSNCINAGPQNNVKLLTEESINTIIPANTLLLMAFNQYI